jgi:hypothetical protein
VVGGRAGSVVVGAGGAVLVPLAATAGAAHIMPISRRHPVPTRATNRRIRRDTMGRRVSLSPMRSATRPMPSPHPSVPRPARQISLTPAALARFRRRANMYVHPPCLLQDNKERAATQVRSQSVVTVRTMRITTLKT